MALVIVLVVAVVSGIGYGVYALTNKPLSAAQAQSANSTATALSNQLLNDPLTSDVNGWSSSTAHCFFASDGYHITDGYYCDAPIGAIADGRMTVTVEQIAGSPLNPYGISFRINKPDTHYFFAIDSNSKWALFRVVNGQFSTLHDYTQNEAIHGGLNVKNTVVVEFRGQNITCSVNGVTIGEVTDTATSLGAGDVALEAGTGVTAVFTNFIAER